MTDDIEQRVIGIISDIAGLKPHKIELSQRLLQDLGIAGGDANEVLMKLEKEFRLDISSFEFLRYFPGEAEIVWWPFRFRREDKKAFEPLTVAQLISAVRLGTLAPTQIGPGKDGPTSA